MLMPLSNFGILYGQEYSSNGLIVFYKHISSYNCSIIVFI